MRTGSTSAAGIASSGLQQRHPPECCLLHHDEAHKPFHRILTAYVIIHCYPPQSIRSGHCNHPHRIAGSTSPVPSRKPPAPASPRAAHAGDAAASFGRRRNPELRRTVNFLSEKSARRTKSPTALRPNASGQAKAPSAGYIADSNVDTRLVRFARPPSGAQIGHIFRGVHFIRPSKHVVNAAPQQISRLDQPLSLPGAQIDPGIRSLRLTDEPSSRPARRSMSRA